MTKMQPTTTETAPAPAPAPATVLHYEALDADDVARFRALRVDDFGNALPVRTFAADESAPCRACLRIAGPGETVLLLALRPFETGGPYAETGPVFIHAGACGPAEDGFPSAFRTRSLTLRGYDRTGEIARATVAAPGEAEVWIAETLGDLAIDVVHARSPAYGCYDFRVVRG